MKKFLLMGALALLGHTAHAEDAQYCSLMGSTARAALAAKQANVPQKEFEKDVLARLNDEKLASKFSDLLHGVADVIYQRDTGSVTPEEVQSGVEKKCLNS